MTECIFVPTFKNKNKYPRVRVNGKKVGLSRVVLARKLGRPIKEGFCALHTCDVPACINADHLFEGTHIENMHDRDRKGRQYDRSGVRNGRAKLTETDVRAIRERLNRGEYALYLSREYGVSSVAIDKIRHRVTWSHV